MQDYKENWLKLKEKHHKYCIFNNTNDLNMNIDFDNDGKLIGTFNCDEKYQGYDEMMHGGIISALIDSSMAQCLFGHGIVAYTVRLNIKFMKSILINKDINIEINIEEKSDHFVNLLAKIIQEDKVKVKADAKFWILNEEER